MNFPLLILTFAVFTCATHTNCRERGDQNGENLKISEVFHIIRYEPAKENACGAQQRCHLVVLDELEPALMPAGALGEERALRQQHEGQQPVEGAQRDDEMEAAQPVALLVAPPGEPRQQEGQAVQRGSVQNGELAPGAALQPGVVLDVPKKGIIDGIPDHKHNLP